MKRIGIDARLINQTGVGVYTRNLLKNLEQHIFQFEVYVYLRPIDYASIDFTNKLFIKRKADYHWHSFSEQYSFFKQLTKDNLDLMHFTYFSYPILYRRPFVITIHDLIPLTHTTGRASTLGPLKYNLKKIGYRLALSSGVKNARRIITPSQFVKNSITEHFGNKYGEKINITYEGINEELLGADENVDLSKKFQKPFFIYVGNFYPHKNVEKLMKAFSQLDIKYSLILIGPDDYFAKRAHQLLSHLQTKNIIFCHNPSLEDFVYFYKNATALIHPSLTEGFGLPLIEASYFSCPIIASDIPVFSEVLGSNYLSFNPHSVEDIQKKIKLFIEKLNDSSMQNFFLSKNQIVREFTFKKMAEQTMRIYQIAL